MINRTNTVLAVLLVAIVVVITLVGGDNSRPNFESFPEMKYTPAWEAFAASRQSLDGRTIFRNGHTMQPTVPGTIARGQMPLHYAATIEDAVRAGEELQNPYSQVPEHLSASIERGGEVYRTFCVLCHGPQGTGDGPVPKRGFSPPPSLQTGKSVRMKDGQLFHILTYGQAAMAPFAAQLPREQRWDVINYVRELQSKAPAVTEPPAN